MSGANLVFWVIVALCAIQSAAFLALARFDPINRPALWFAGAFAAAGASYLGEIALAAGASPGPTRMVIALAMTLMLVLLAYGLARRYRVEMPAGSGFAILAASGMLYYLILDLPRADFSRQMLYQTPYALLSFLALSVVARARGKVWTDWLFVVLFAFLGLHFLAKPFLAEWTGGVGSGPTGYAGTLYAGISSASAAVLLVILATAGLALILGDTARRLVRRAERDPETGLLNRAGFSAHAARRVQALAEIEGPDGDCHDLALMLIAMNRPRPAHARERPLAILATLIGEIVPKEALVGRMADCEFAVLAPGSNLFAARQMAETLRKKIRERLGETATNLSLGITEREPGDAYPDLLARGLWALDEAERAGGNCVRLATRSGLGAAAIRQG